MPISAGMPWSNPMVYFDQQIDPRERDRENYNLAKQNLSMNEVHVFGLS